MAISSSIAAEQLTQEWDYLPNHILDIIINKLVSLVDYLSFSSVCKRWHSVARHVSNKKPRMMITTSTPQALPLLLLPSQHNNVKQLFDFTKNRVYDFKLNLPPNFTNIRVSGSSHGWLIFVEKGLILLFYLTLSLVRPYVFLQFHSTILRKIMMIRVIINSGLIRLSCPEILFCILTALRLLSSFQICLDLVSISQAKTHGPTT